MSNISNLFGGEFTPPDPVTPERLDPPEIQFINAITAQGYQPPASIVFDGQVHRFSTTGKKRDDSGWYVAYDGKVHAGAFGCWKETSSIPWRENIGREFSPMEEIEHANRMKEIRKKAEDARQQKQESAADTSNSIWSNASDASDDHPYLKAKGVKCHGLKITGDGRLIIPRWGESGEIASLQFIDQDGDKKFKGGGKATGTFYCVGHVSSQTKTVFVAEGYATASSVYETTGEPCFVAFNAGNLPEVAKIARANFSGDLCIIADHDLENANTGRREGIYKAEEAARETRARVVYPPIEGMDANDYQQSGNDLAALLIPPVPTDYLTAADDFCEQPAPIKWLIKNFIQRESLIMVHGPSGGGKTFAVLDKCLHIASDKSLWFGHKVTHGSVVYLAGEGHAGLRARVAAWKQHHDVKYLNMWISKSGTDLNKPEGLQKVTAAIDSLPSSPSLVVVDTLHRFMAGDENSSQDAKTMLDACAAIQQRYPGCSVLLVHHTGVNDEAQHRARGSSAWRGALENEFSVVPSTEDNPMQIIARKMKDSELPEPVYTKLHTVGINGWFDEDGDQVTSAVIIESSGDSIKTDSKADKFKLEFMEAWAELGKERRAGGCHYITNSALKDWLVTKGKSERTAKNYVDPSRKNEFMGYLKSQNMADRYDAGWILFASPDDAANALLGG